MNTPNLTHDDLIQYYIDCIGMSEEEVINLTFGELVAGLNEAQLNDCFAYNNKN